MQSYESFNVGERVLVDTSKWSKVPIGTWEAIVPCLSGLDPHGARAAEGNYRAVPVGMFARRGRVMTRRSLPPATRAASARAKAERASSAARADSCGGAHGLVARWHARHYGNAGTIGLPKLGFAGRTAHSDLAGCPLHWSQRGSCVSDHVGRTGHVHDTEGRPSNRRYADRARHGGVTSVASREGSSRNSRESDRGVRGERRRNHCSGVIRQYAQWRDAWLSEQNPCDSRWAARCASKSLHRFRSPRCFYFKASVVIPRTMRGAR